MIINESSGSLKHIKLKKDMFFVNLKLFYITKVFATSESRS